PPQIKMVPTMIVAGVNKPLVAEAAFKWIEGAKFRRQQELGDTNKRIIQQNLVNMAQNNKKGPLGFVEQEMAGISDTFAYKDIDKPLSHNYVGAGEDNKNVIFTAPDRKRTLKYIMQFQINTKKYYTGFTDYILIIVNKIFKMKIIIKMII
ncbi:unnamed protein product, partial [marine sediment metagenome]